MGITAAPGRQRVGRQTIAFSSQPRIMDVATVAGPKEGEGPLGSFMDIIHSDDLLGEKSWEKAETRMLCEAVELAAEKANVRLQQVDLLVAGDLLNEIIASSFAARQLDLPFLGIYGACSAFTEALGIAAMAVDGGFAQRAIAAVSSHHSTAERQFRFPTELAVQKPPSAQWTATGSAAAVLTHPQADSPPQAPRVTHATFGRVVDMGIKDPFDLGAAMAPAATDTIRQHLVDLQRQPDYYDLILTGDLAGVGLPIAQDLLAAEGLDVKKVFADCGLRLYDSEQQVGAGASGCASSGLVFSAEIFPQLEKGEIRRLLLIGTGALLSKISAQQGESIPGIAHAIAIEAAAADEEGEASP